MAARLKSSVLRREERGIGSITMGRLIVSAMIGGLCFFAMRLLGLSILMIPMGIAAFVGSLVLTHPRHGIPLYLHLLITFRARLLVQALRPRSWQAQVTRLLELKRDSLTLDTAQVLSVPAAVEDDGDLDAWEIVPDSAHAAGFEVVGDSLQLEVR
jgi:hypothetical protein